MDKKDVLESIINIARLYDENLNNRRTLFVYADANGKHQTIEMFCRSSNFLHLTGCKSHLSPNMIFNRAVKGNLSIDDFYYSSNINTIIRKLYALRYIVNIHKSTSRIGEYNNSRVSLNANMIIGATQYCLALVYDNKQGHYTPSGIYVPVSAMQDDIVALTIKPMKLLAVFQQKSREKKYSLITYVAPKFHTEQLRLNPDIIERIEPKLIFSQRKK